MEKDIDLLISIGISKQKALETVKNTHVTNNIKYVVAEVSKYKKIDSVIGTLIYHLASKIKPQIENQIPFLAQYIDEKKLNSVHRIDCALNYLLDNVKTDFKIQEFETACGIGIIVTPEEIENEVENCIKRHRMEIEEKRYRFNTGLLMQEIRNSLVWADGKAIKNEIDIQLFDLLGPKMENEDVLAVKQSKKLNKPEKMQKNKEFPSESLSKTHYKPVTINDIIKSKVHFHKPGENYKTEGYVVTNNTLKLLEEHLKSTSGEVRTRFPPEPNGILHIGHAKAININFGYAAVYNGSCYLRYDDTNPEKEEEKFVTGIFDIVNWLGYSPAKITYSSDYFDILFEWAILLIKKDLAYVCHQSANEVKGYKSLPSPWRNRPITESLRIFNDMKNGLLNEGDATLRMKVTLEEGKQDPVAYRIKFSNHHRTENKWCIYPTYDFTHCLCDSIENITHSLCTKEFQSRRSSYYWLCNALDIYCPVQWEYGRLNISYTVVSKRKILKLIDKKIVRDWDDPRLFTLSALRRRGYPPEAINNFCAQMGITGAQTIVSPNTLEASVRDTLNIAAPRHMVVTEPLRLTISNFSYEKPLMLEVPNFPGERNKGSHNISFEQTIYIDSSDFREEAEKDFKRLTIRQSVGLKYAGVVLTVQKIEKDTDNSIKNIIVHQELINEENKPKAFIHWVSRPSLARIRLYEKLFKHVNPEDSTEVPNGFLSDINYKSKKETFAYIDKSLEENIKSFHKFQFERVGFFSVDPDSKPKKVIFNRTVTLKETNMKI